MTDRELLKFAAKAAGINEKDWDLPDFTKYEWNPLENDGDALRLAVKLKIGMIFHHGLVIVGKENKCYADEMVEDYKYAIVRAAAQLGKEMK